MTPDEAREHALSLAALSQVHQQKDKDKDKKPSDKGRKAGVQWT